MQLPASAVGSRVVVRSRTGATAASGRPELTDTVGVVLDVDSETVRLEHRTGRQMSVRQDAIVTWKQVPEPLQVLPRQPPE